MYFTQQWTQKKVFIKNTDIVLWRVKITGLTQCLRMRKNCCTWDLRSFGTLRSLDCHSTLRNIPEKRRIHLHLGGSQKSFNSVESPTLDIQDYEWQLEMTVHLLLPKLFGHRAHFGFRYTDIPKKGFGKEYNKIKQMKRSIPTICPPVLIKHPQYFSSWFP